LKGFDDGKGQDSVSGAPYTTLRNEKRHSFGEKWETAISHLILYVIFAAFGLY
jgi:hypothetical protein